MQITHPLLKLLPGETKLFALDKYTSILSVCTRLKRIGMGSYKTERTKDKVLVTRLSLPTVSDANPDGIIKPLRRLNSAKDDLTYRAWIFDDRRDSYEVYLTLVKDGLSHRIKMSPGKDFPLLADKILEFIDFQIKQLK